MCRHFAVRPECSSSTADASIAACSFRQGLASLGWAVVVDSAPREATGLYGRLFNIFGNIWAITTPIVIVYIVAVAGSFAGGLVSVGANTVLAVIAYRLIVGLLNRVQLTESEVRAIRPLQPETRS